MSDWMTPEVVVDVNEPFINEAEEKINKIVRELESKTKMQVNEMGVYFRPVKTKGYTRTVPLERRVGIQLKKPEIVMEF